MGKRNKFCPYKKFCREECYGSPAVRFCARVRQAVTEAGVVEEEG